MAECRNVFVYGSLLADEVLQVLLKRIPRSCDALVHGYHRYSVRHRKYPAAIAKEGEELKGKVLLDLTGEELEILDEFEGDEYTKHIVNPLLATEKESSLTAFLYAWTDTQDSDLFGTWDYEEWRVKELSKYISMCEEYVESGSGF